VHSTRPAERALWLLKSGVKRTGAERSARKVVSLTARRTYDRTLRFVPNREELPFVLNARGLTGFGAEIGVARGAFSEHLLENWRGRQLLSIDPWLSMDESDYVDACNMPQDSMDESYEFTTQRLARFGERSAIKRATGAEGAAELQPATLDFVYIDAMHTFEAVLSDLGDWFPLVKSGGIIAGHDYNDGEFAEGVHGVRSAVDEFFGRRSLPVLHTYTDVPSISWIVGVP
jgi:hypothetical protein